MLLRWIHVQTFMPQAKPKVKAKSKAKSQSRKGPREFCWHHVGYSLQERNITTYISYIHIYHISIFHPNRKDLHIIPWCHYMAWKLAFLCLEAPLLCVSWSGQPRRRRHTILQWQGIEVSVVTECHLWGFMGVILHPTNEWRRNGW